MIDLELRVLEYFVEAACLHVSQPALSKQLGRQLARLRDDITIPRRDHLLSTLRLIWHKD